MPNLVEIIVKSIDESAAGFATAETKAKASGARAGKNFSEGMKPSIAGIGKALVGTFAIAGGIEVFKGLIERGEQAERSAGLVEAAIKSTGGAAHVSAEQIFELARATSEKTGKDELAIQAGDAMLLTFKRVQNVAGENNDIFTQASSVLTDMTAALHGGEVSSEGMRKQAIQLGKALNDPVKGVTALRRVGVTLSAQQQQQIKDLENTGHHLEAQKMILHELRTEFEGAAAASSTGLDRLGNSFRNLEDDVVHTFTPAITGATDALSHFFAAALHGETQFEGQNKPGGIVGFMDDIFASAHKDTQISFDFIRSIDNITKSITNSIPGGKAINHWLDGFQGKSEHASESSDHLSESVDTQASKTADLIHPTEQANASIFQTGKNAKDAAPKVQTLTDKVTALKNAQFQLSAAVSWDQLLVQSKNDALNLSKALDKSKNSVGLHTQKERDARSASETYISDLIQMAKQAGNNKEKQDLARQAIERVIPKLENVKNKSSSYRDMLSKLKDMLQQLANTADPHLSIFMRGKGTWGIFGKNPVNSGLFNAPGGASGMFVDQGTTPTADDVVIRASRGELVVPTNMVNSGEVDHLRGRIPGFASGGISGSYQGSPGQPYRNWIGHNWNSTMSIIANSMAQGMANAFKNSMAGMFGGLGRFGGALGGSAAANRALAMRMFPWPMSMFPSFNALEMSEAGYSLIATNPSSGAYGMAQFINGPSEYYQYGGNPYTAGGQLIGMFNYIKQRYGNPVNAWNFHLAHNWYDDGGYLPPGLSLAYNGTGAPEPVGPTAMGGGGGGHVHITFDFRGADQGLINWIRNVVQVHGGNVQEAFGDW